MHWLNFFCKRCRRLLHLCYTVAWQCIIQVCLITAQRGHFDIPRSRTAFGSRSFSTAAPLAWNELPADICDITTTVTFKKHLKTLLFNVAYGPAFL